MRRHLAYAALALGACGSGMALGAVVVPPGSADGAPAAVHRVELRALYGPTGSVADLRRIETWHVADRVLRRETVLSAGVSFESLRANGRVEMRDGGSRPVVVHSRSATSADDVDARAARLRAALELGWMQRVAETEVGGRRALVLRARPASRVDQGWTVAVDPSSFTPIAGERRAKGRLVERARLLVDERMSPAHTPLEDTSLSLTRSVRSEDRRLTDMDHNSDRSMMTNRTRVTRALASLAAVSAIAGTATATATAAPAGPPIQHWVLETKTMSGDVGRTEGWQRSSARHVVDGSPIAPGFPWCKSVSDWKLRSGNLTVCGRKVKRNRSLGLPAPSQMLSPTELGQLNRKLIDRGAYEAAGEDVIDGRRVTVWREADRAGFGPEDERKLILTTLYLDAADGSFVAERQDNVATGKTQETRVLVDEAVAASATRLAKAGLPRASKR